MRHFITIIATTFMVANRLHIVALFLFVTISIVADILLFPTTIVVALFISATTIIIANRFHISNDYCHMAIGFISAMTTVVANRFHISIIANRFNNQQNFIIISDDYSRRS